MKGLWMIALAGWAGARDVESLDRGWRFFQGNVAGAEAAGFDDSTWSRVDTPHDWSIAGSFEKDAAAGGSAGWCACATRTIRPGR
ncbi:hypothetical protein [Haloferula sargassicola]|uniref:Beta-galactosidase n=1 Tax=Haloferula sargassicola TaxID=490096 RepID=A0ABP9UI40_9BACT